MITVMFRCVGNNEKENPKGVVVWTITFERKIGNLTTEIKTISREIADRFIVQREYPINIPEDHELGGVFGEQTEAEAGSSPEPTFEETLAARIRGLMDANDGSRTDFNLLLDTTARFFLPDCPSISEVEAKRDELHDQVLAIVETYCAEKRRAEIRQLAERYIEDEGIPTAETLADEVFLELYADAVDKPGDEQLAEVRQEVEFYLAEREAKLAGATSPPPENADAEAPPTEAQPKPAKKRGRPTGSKNKPK